MYISYNWIKDFLKIDLPKEEISDLLTDIGLEVETTKELTKGGFEKGLVVGEVISCEKHPNADKLSLIKVDIGEAMPLNIVCGAPNVAEKQKVVVATIGTTLYDDGNGTPLKIKKTKIRGEVSQGMLCAEDELGLGTTHDGIIILDDKYKVGTPCAKIFQNTLASDVIFEIGLTPNRSDAMSHYGVARDLVAVLRQRKLMNLFLNLPKTAVIDNIPLYEQSRIKINIKEKALTPNYLGVCMDVVIADSPQWLKDRLLAINIIPKNNIVDITNYVLHELGQPLHAFDREQILGDELIIRKAKKGEKLITLDNVERVLDVEDLLICNKEKPMCIAGVLGGKDYGVTQNTKSIFIESASFDAISIRKTAKRHIINTDSSFRYERGIYDSTMIKMALERAVWLLTTYAEATNILEIDDYYSEDNMGVIVDLSLVKMAKVIDIEIDYDTTLSILKSLEMKILGYNNGVFSVEVPPYRVDVTREIDIIEEILRIYGYNNVNSNSSEQIFVGNNVNCNEEYEIETKIANQLVAQGFYEIMTNSITDPEYTKENKHYLPQNNVEIINPLGKRLSIMRRSLLYGGLEAISYNINRQQKSLKLFEFGKIYTKQEEKYKETKILSLLTCGDEYNFPAWNKENKEIDYYYLKSIVINILKCINITDIQMNEIKDTYQISQGLRLSYKNNIIADIGVIDTNITNIFSIKKNVLFTSFRWDNVLELAKKERHRVKVSKIPKYPKVERDFSLLLDTKVTFDKIYKLAYKTASNLLKDVILFDVYEGEKLPKNKKSYGVKFIFQDENKTLTDTQIEHTMSRLALSLEKELQAEFR